MADKPNYTPFSIVIRLFWGMLTVAMGGGLFIDAVASQNPQWQAKTRQIGFEATQKYLRVLAAFEGVKE